MLFPLYNLDTVSNNLTSWRLKEFHYLHGPEKGSLSVFSPQITSHLGDIHE